MYQYKTPRLRNMWVCIFKRYSSVCCPSRMCNSYKVLMHIYITFTYFRSEPRNLSNRLDALYFLFWSQYCYSSTIVSPVFQFLKTTQKQWNCRIFSRIRKNSAHIIWLIFSQYQRNNFFFITIRTIYFEFYNVSWNLILNQRRNRAL